MDLSNFQMIDLGQKYLINNWMTMFVLIRLNYISKSTQQVHLQSTIYINKRPKIQQIYIIISSTKLLFLWFVIALKKSNCFEEYYVLLSQFFTTSYSFKLVSQKKKQLYHKQKTHFEMQININDWNKKSLTFYLPKFYHRVCQLHKKYKLIIIKRSHNNVKDH